MADLDEFKNYYALSAQLVEQMSKEDLAECARMLALHLANWRFAPTTALAAAFRSRHRVAIALAWGVA